MRIVRDERVGHGRLIWFGTAAVLGYFVGGWRGAGAGVLFALALLIVLLAFAIWGERRKARGLWPY
jgi:hypothetical protein